ncbi:hypothetical protein AX16_003726 [Volvariella volvacea WC 439]|nr:hypothetical protein AX16_003726 [Volvariella volvacea WC 439]
MNDTRPDTKLIKRSYGYLFNSGWTLTKIRDVTLSDRLLQSQGNTLGVAGRSLLWKVALLISEPLRHNATLSAPSLLDFLRSSRAQYVDILSDKMRAPDGSYEPGLDLPSTPFGNSKRQSNGSKAEFITDLETNNPLSLHSENPWKDWFAAVELRKTISQDVERTFPDIAFFRDTGVQRQLTTILFLWAVNHPEIGYRQGMHELLAPLYFTVDYDSLAEGDAGDISDLWEICNRRWVTADAWALFNAIMLGASRWYEWQEGKQPANKTHQFKSHHHINVTEAQAERKPYVAPIVAMCDKIQNTMLKSVDPVLWKYMHSSGIEPQIYGIRWLRMLFTREFSLPDSMKLWDRLFICDASLDLAPWICVAMLIRIRTTLMSSDYSGQLTVLLRYPTPPTGAPGLEHHANLLFRQAQALQVAPVPATGAAISLENRTHLNIPIEVPESVTHVSSKGVPIRPKSATSPRGGEAGLRPQASSSQLGLPEMIARGLLERGESLGINKTFMSAVSELRRNIPELAASFVRSPSTSDVFPLEDERPAEERPPWEPRTRFEMERDIAQLKARNRKLGESLGWIVDALLQDETETIDKANLVKRKQEALESLSYVRDALLGGTGDLEEDRLFGEEERKRRQERLKSEAAKRQTERRSVDIQSPVAAAPIPTAESKAKTRALPTRRQSYQSLLSTSPPRIPPSANQIQSATSHNPNRIPPWVHTKSSFSGDIVGLPSTALPRLPPPTSTALRRQTTLQTADQTPPAGTHQQDPLGALP